MDGWSSELICRPRILGDETSGTVLEGIFSEMLSCGIDLQELSAQFEEKTAEQRELKDKADTMERRLEAASRLIAGLGSEKTRWTAETKELDSSKEKLIGDCLLSSSFLSYLGAS